MTTLFTYEQMQGKRGSPSEMQEILLNLIFATLLHHSSQVTEQKELREWRLRSRKRNTDKIIYKTIIGRRPNSTSNIRKTTNLGNGIYLYTKTSLELF